MPDLTTLKNRDHFGYWLNEQGLRGVGVEVGSLSGGNARKIMEQWMGQRLHLVDTWGKHEPDQYRERTDWTNFKECKRLCQQLANDYPDRVDLYQDRSLEAVSAFADGELDFVYLDAAHDFCSVIADCVAWWPKVKKGGVMGFHDATYNDTVWPAYNEVKRALEEWLPFMKLTPHITPECTSAWVVKP